MRTDNYYSNIDYIVIITRYTSFSFSGYHFKTGLGTEIKNTGIGTGIF